MTERDPVFESKPLDPSLHEEEVIEASWKPLLWLGGILLSLVALWEIFLELGIHIFSFLLQVIEHLWLVLIEAPEELLEDKIEDWLKVHFPHDADYYSEIVTAFGLMPVKALLVVFLLKWLWNHSRTTLLPKVKRWLYIRVSEVKLAWAALAWPYKVLIIVVLVPIVVIIL